MDDKEDKKMAPETENHVENTKKRPDEQSGFHFEGHIKIFDPQSGQIFIDKRNAIHYENMSVAMANSISNQGKGTF